MAEQFTYDFTVRRSDNTPQLQWSFQTVDVNDKPVFDGDGDPVLLDLSGSEFVLTMRGPGFSMVLRSEDDEIEVDTADDFVAWAITQAQARKFPIGKAVTYELQRLISGTSQVLAVGTITGIGGLSNG